MDCAAYVCASYRTLGLPGSHPALRKSAARAVPSGSDCGRVWSLPASLVGGGSCLAVQGKPNRVVNTYSGSKVTGRTVTNR